VELSGKLQRRECIGIHRVRSSVRDLAWNGVEERKAKAEPEREESVSVVKHVMWAGEFKDRMRGIICT
jgi:hypothetical protein